MDMHPSSPTGYHILCTRIDKYNLALVLQWVIDEYAGRSLDNPRIGIDELITHKNYLGGVNRYLFLFRKL